MSRRGIHWVMYLLYAAWHIKDVMHIVTAMNDAWQRSAHLNLLIIVIKASDLMTRFLYLLFPCIVSGFIISNAAFSAQAASMDAGKVLAKKLFAEGGELFASGQYLASADAFRRAYEASPTWKLLFNLAQSETAAKRYGLAIEAFERYLSEGGDDIDVNRSQNVMAEIQRLRMLVGVLDVSAPEGTVVFVDDVSRGNVPLTGPLRVAVGEHQLRLAKDGEVLLTRRIAIASGMTTTVSVNGRAHQESAHAKNAPATKPVENSPGASDNKIALRPSVAVQISSDHLYPVQSKGWLFGGITASAVGLVGISLGAIFTVKFVKSNNHWENARDDYNASSVKTLSMFNSVRSLYDDAQRDRKWLLTGYIAGGLGAVAGTLLLLKYGSDKRKRRLSLDPSGRLNIWF